jgi:hypothetical protein
MQRCHRSTGFVLRLSLPTAGELLTTHIRSIDAQARPIRHAGVAYRMRSSGWSGRTQHLHHG